MGRPATDKRERLVSAAIEQFHRQGYARTSLADIAKAAGISTGNVFYYFKAKDDLALAVVDEWRRRLAGYLAALEGESDPWLRIVAFIEQARALRGMYVKQGCPLAGLTRDLRQEGEALQNLAARIYDVQFQWLARQFQIAGFAPDAAEQHTRFLMSGYHGAILLAFTQGDASLIDFESARLTCWLNDLQRGASVRKP